MNMVFFQEYTRELIATGILGILLILFRIIATKLVRRYAKQIKLWIIEPI
jgi:hypothetical protein